MVIHKMEVVEVAIDQSEDVSDRYLLYHGTMELQQSNEGTHRTEAHQFFRAP